MLSAKKEPPVFRRGHLWTGMPGATREATLTYCGERKPTLRYT
jgi:hypothetical protein